MSKNRTMEHPHDYDLLWANSTGSTVTSGSVVIVRGKAYVAAADIADGTTGCLQGTGSFWLPKAAGGGFAPAQGQVLGWDTSTKKVVASTANGVQFKCVTAALDADDTVEVALIGNGGSAAYASEYSASAGDDSANQVDFTHNRGVNPTFCIVVIKNTSNVQRVGATVTYPDTNTIRVAEANLAVGEKIEILAHFA